MPDKFENTDQKTTKTSTIHQKDWKLQKREVQEKYKKAIEESINSTALLSDPDSGADVESIWTETKSCLINACDSVCGWMKRNSKQDRNMMVG